MKKRYYNGLCFMYSEKGNASSEWHQAEIIIFTNTLYFPQSLISPAVEVIVEIEPAATGVKSRVRGSTRPPTYWDSTDKNHTLSPHNLPSLRPTEQ